jgi:hypothetical protein
MAAVVSHRTSDASIDRWNRSGAGASANADDSHFHATVGPTIERARHFRSQHVANLDRRHFPEHRSRPCWWGRDDVVDVWMKAVEPTAEARDPPFFFRAHAPSKWHDEPFPPEELAEPTATQREMST